MRAMKGQTLAGAPPAAGYPKSGGVQVHQMAECGRLGTVPRSSRLEMLVKWLLAP